jgi:hypothetical protein
LGAKVLANPAYSHVLVVVEENHGYSDIIGNTTDAPYINGVLATGGVVLTNAYGEQHPSQPNYYWLFSGSNQGITNDTPPSAPTNSSTNNLYNELQDHFAGTAQSNNFFGGYADQFPGVSNAYNDGTNYVVRHVPWLGFSSINGGNPAAITQDFGAFPLNNFGTLPAFSFITPGLNDDMHDYNSTGSQAHGTNITNALYSSQAISNGDAWLSNNLNAYATGQSPTTAFSSSLGMRITQLTGQRRATTRSTPMD